MNTEFIQKFLREIPSNTIRNFFGNYSELLLIISAGNRLETLPRHRKEFLSEIPLKIPQAIPIRISPGGYPRTSPRVSQGIALGNSFCIFSDVISSDSSSNFSRILFGNFYTPAIFFF